MCITKDMMKDIDKIVPGVEELAKAYQAGYRRQTIDFCKESLISVAMSMEVFYGH